MKTREQITSEIHEIARGFGESSFCTPYVSILQPRRDIRETPAQQLASHINRMVDFSSMSVSFHAIGGQPVDVADCYLIEKALEDNSKYALFIEDDTVLPSYGAVRLIETSKQHPGAIVVGVYYVKFGGPMISMKDEESRWTYIDATPNTGLRRNIPSCGLGCCLIPMECIRRIKAQFPDIPLFCIVPEGCWGDDRVKALGQDTWFYNLVAKCGIEVICDTSVQCLHMELSTGKYTAHPDVNLDDYLTSIPITEPLTLRDRDRVSAVYVSTLRQPNFINGLDTPVVGLPVDYTPETQATVEACMRDVQCTQNFYEASRLCERVKALDPRVILEIGVDRGGSMNMWLAVSKPGAHYVGVDQTPELVMNREHRGMKKTLIKGDSRDGDTLASVRKILDGRPVDFLFIDGGHEEATVRTDLELYGPLVRKGGIVAMHDIAGTVNREHCKGVIRLWEEIKKSQPSAEEFVNTESEFHFGIGMYVK